MKKYRNAAPGCEQKSGCFAPAGNLNEGLRPSPGSKERSTRVALRLLRRVILILFLLINFMPVPERTIGRDVSKSTIQISSAELFAQTPEENKSINQENNADKSVLIKVMLVVLFIWFGIALYLFSLDRKIKKLEKNIHEI